MDNEILFVNKRPEICEAFREKITACGWKVDTAVTGLDAVVLLKKKEYKLIITGMMLKTFDGEQMITYLNKTKPDTVIIVYTKSVTPAQLYFLYNERNVFRIFLRPLPFEREFQKAIEEGLELYDCRCVIREERERRLERERKQKEDMEAVQKQLAHLQASGDAYMGFVTQMLDRNRSYYAEGFTEAELKEIEAYRMAAVTNYRLVHEEFSELEQVKQEILKEFSGENETENSFDMVLPSAGICYTSASMEKVRYLIALYLECWKKVFGGYRLSVKADMNTGSIISFTMRFDLYEEEWKEAMGKKMENAILTITENIAESMSSRLVRTAKPTSVTVEMELELERR